MSRYRTGFYLKHDHLSEEKDDMFMAAKTIEAINTDFFDIKCFS